MGGMLGRQTMIICSQQEGEQTSYATFRPYLWCIRGRNGRCDGARRVYRLASAGGACESQRGT